MFLCLGKKGVECLLLSGPGTRKWGKGIYNNIYLLQLGCNSVAVVILHVYKI